MNITVNGEPTRVGQQSTVAETVAQVVGGRTARGVAVAVNGEVVPRSSWEVTTLADGDAVEVLTAVQGG